MDVAHVGDLCNKIIREVQKVIVGKKDIIRYLLIGLFAGGHVLLEGVPGVAKTFMANNFSKTLGLTFKRIQFTPDLLPADIIGTHIFDQKEGTFRYRKGPIFANVILADEINRAPPKTQSALLEAMQEKQVTVEGETFKLPMPFLVIATQNPIEFEGTYPLPEAQVDRFHFKLEVDYPTMEEEIEIIRRKSYPKDIEVKTITSPQEILEVQKLIRTIYVSDELLRYISEIVNKTRKIPELLLGAGPRASIVLLGASRVIAAMDKRDYVIPDDIKEVAVASLNHRLVLKPEAELEGLTVVDVIKKILDEVEVPS
ncbi:MAG: MoxR family ATPase [Candidatus Odinarchaeota archaeon]|nr:MoxR family ATPase [Candidatus Odinarchaeota archaeon]